MMQFKKLSGTVIFFLLVHSSIAQGVIESSPAGTTRDGGLVVYGTISIGDNKRIPYERISGSPFWKPEFQMAVIVDPNNYVVGRAFSKLNLYTNELYFVTPKGEVRVAAPDRVRKIVFYNGKDTTSEVAAVFENNLAALRDDDANRDNSTFVQVLNNGDVQLLKRIKILLMTGDSLFGTMKRYYFLEQVSYYMHNKFSQHTHFRKLSRNNVLENLRIGDPLEKWIKENAINFKKEEDVIRFLNYYNSQKKG